MKNIKQAVIFCGGLGSRLGNLTKNQPKAMIKICGKPFLEHLLIQLKKNGIKKILLLTGYKQEVIKNYFLDGKKLNIKINYSFMSVETETGSRLFNVKSKLDSKFLLLYSDNYSSLNIHKLNEKLEKSKKKIILSIAKKNKGNCNFDNLLNVRYSRSRSKKNPFVEIGYMIVKKEVLKYLNENDKDFTKFLEKISKKKMITANIQINGYLSIGDKKRLNQTKKFFLNNDFILIDRDGVLNLKSKYHRYVRNLSELSLNHKFIKKLPNKSKLICITNQAGIATKQVKFDNLLIINEKIKNSLRKNRINLLKFYISQDHFNSASFNRKPNPGLFFKASDKYKFILDKTFYIGDDKRDIEAAYNANTFIIYIGKKKLTNEEKIKYKFIILKNKIIEIYNEKIKYNF